jgi:hypothetical protein
VLFIELSRKLNTLLWAYIYSTESEIILLCSTQRKYFKNVRQYHSCLSHDDILKLKYVLLFFSDLIHSTNEKNAKSEFISRHSLIKKRIDLKICFCPLRSRPSNSWSHGRCQFHQHFTIIKSQTSRFSVLSV